MLPTMRASERLRSIFRPWLLKALMLDRPHEAQLRVEVSKRESRRLGVVMPRSGELERSRRILLRFSYSAILGKVYGRMRGGEAA